MKSQHEDQAKVAMSGLGIRKEYGFLALMEDLGQTLEMILTLTIKDERPVGQKQPGHC